MNIFQLIRQDHREIDGLLSRLQLAPDRADFDNAGRQYLLDRLVSVASRHEAAEELALWPQVRRRLPEGAELADQALCDERGAKAILDLLRFAGSEEDLAESCAELHRIVLAHARFEEETVFPRMRIYTTRLWASLAGVRFRMARWAGPTRAHPNGPDRPLGLLTIGVPAVMLDHLRDLGKRQRRHPVGFDEPGRADAVTILEAQHARIGRLLTELESQSQGDDQLLRSIIREVSAHNAIERQYLNRAVRRRLPDGDARYQQLVNGLGRIGRLTAKLDVYHFHDDARAEWVQELITDLRAHIEEEEAAVLPALAARMTHEELVDLGERLETASAKAPTRPHPHAAGAGAGARLSSLLVRPVDRARDALDAWRPSLNGKATETSLTQEAQDGSP